MERPQPRLALAVVVEVAGKMVRHQLAAILLHKVLLVVAVGILGVVGQAVKMITLLLMVVVQQMGVEA